MEETHPCSDLRASDSRTEFSKRGQEGGCCPASCLTGWVFWLEFQSAGFYLPVLHRLVQSCVLRTRAMVASDVQKNPRNLLGLMKPDPVFLTLMLFRRMVFVTEQDGVFPWGEGFLGRLGSQPGFLIPTLTLAFQPDDVDSAVSALIRQNLNLG